MGGTPFRLVRLSRSGGEALDALLAGERPVTGAAAKLRDRLLDAAMAHPIPNLDSSKPSFAIVIPVLDDQAGLRQLLAALRDSHPGVPIVVVDDGSTDEAAIKGVALDYDATVVRQERNRGPAAARNIGWRGAISGDAPPEVIVFLDADVVPGAQALELLVAHFADPKVAAVASRVRAQPGAGTLARYEVTNSPLDLGSDPALVAPGARVSYVPSASLAVRVSDLVEFDGFAEDMRTGEDVDFVWRLTDRERTVRYEPRSVAEHRSRSSLVAMARQRFGYGLSAGDLGQRHNDRIAPLQIEAPTLASTMAMVAGGPLIRLMGALGGGWSVMKLRNLLDGSVDEPTNESVRLQAMSHGYALQGMAAAATRVWAPALMLSRRSRKAWLAALVVPALIDWIRDRPANDPIRHIVLRAIDHSSYCAGVWAGAWKHRSLTALLPKISLPDWSEPKGS